VTVFWFIEAEQAEFPISLSARMLGVSRSGFHAWRRRAPCERTLSDAWLTVRITEIHAQSRGTYGSPRVHAELRRQGIRVGRKRVERLMRAAGLSGYHKRRKGKTTISVHGVRVADDLVERDFNPSAPDRLWCADIKEIPTWEGKLYLASVLDCFSRKVVGWSMRTDMQAELVVDALEMAVARRRPVPGLVHHSDQGSQGGFNPSSQHLDHGGVAWGRCGSGSGRFSSIGGRCRRRGGRRWRGDRTGWRSGRQSGAARRRRLPRS
jgi:putative transposase